MNHILEIEMDDYMEISCKEKIISNEYSDWFVDFVLTEELINYTDRDDDSCIQQVSDTLGIAHVRRNRENLLRFAPFEYQYLPELYGLQWDLGEGSNDDAYVIGMNGELQSAETRQFDPTPLIDTGILKVQRAPLNLTGKGCVVAFLDTGINYDNPVFRNTDGSSRILAIWDQELQTGTPPEGFLYGSEYKKEEINQALLSEKPYELVPTRDLIGHGTAMASVVVGSVLGGGAEFLGIVPNCEIVVVKLKEAKEYLKDYYYVADGGVAYASTDIVMALKYLDQFAVEFEKPIIFCIGVGCNLGSHTGSGKLCDYLEEISRKRSRAIVICGGNEGNAQHHFQGIFRQEENNSAIGSLKQEVEIKVGKGEKGFVLELWGSIPNVFTISIRSPSGEVVRDNGIFNGLGMEYGFVYEKTRIRIDYALTEQGSGDQLILMRFQNPTEGIWTIIVNNEGGLLPAEFHMWLPITNFLTSETYFLKPDPDVTLTVPSYEEEVMVVSTYDSYNDRFYLSSGRGFSRDGMIKPDIASPGVDISATQNAIQNKPLITQISGSSMAAAICTGAATQLMQWAVVEKNAIYARSKEIKNYLIRGALRDEDLVYPNSKWGFGQLNMEGVFENIRRL